MGTRRGVRFRRINFDVLFELFGRIIFSSETVSIQCCSRQLTQETVDSVSFSSVTPPINNTDASYMYTVRVETGANISNHGMESLSILMLYKDEPLSFLWFFPNLSIQS